MPKYIRIGLIVEDKHCDAYKFVTEKIWDRVRGYPLRKNKTIPATRKLRVWIEQYKDKYDFVFVLVDLDTPAHHKNPKYFQDLRKICQEEGAALLVVKRELESWILADVNSIARWKLGDNTTFRFKIYHNTAMDPWEPKEEILKLICQAARYAGKKEPKVFNPSFHAEISEKVVLNNTTLEHNCSLRCFYDLVKGCADIGGQQYFADYPQVSHCESPKIPE